MKKKLHIVYYLLLSTIAVILLLLLAFFGSSNITTIGKYDKFILGGAFIIICVFGISLSFHPGWYKRVYYARESNENN